MVATRCLRVCRPIPQARRAIATQSYSTHTRSPAPTSQPPPPPPPPQKRLSFAMIDKIQRQAAAMDRARESMPEVLPSPKNRASDSLFVLSTLGLLLASPAIIWFYWDYREKHMYNKKKQLLAEAQARYQAKGGA